MCVIIHLKRGQQIPYKLFENAVYNNPHGFGIIMRANGQIDVKKVFTEPEDVDPEALYKIVYDNADAERVVHLRWKTEGILSEGNVHPFLIHEVGKNKVFFAHNGTLNKYSGDKWVNSVRVKSEKSDSQNFAETYLSPLFKNFRLTQGVVDLENEFLKKMIDAEWTSPSRGIIIDALQEPIKLGTWLTIDGTVEGESISVSNNTYFNTLTRGPKYEEEKAKEDAARRAAISVVGINSNNNQLPALVRPVMAMESQRFHLNYGLSRKLTTLFEGKDLNTVSGLALTSNMTYDEFEEMAKHNPRETAQLLVLLSSRVRQYALEG